MVFLAKCAMCILLVCIALQWRPGGAPPAPRGQTVSAARHGAAGSAASSLMRAGVETLADAAREKCLAAPRDCLAAAQRLQSAAPRAR